MIDAEDQPHQPIIPGLPETEALAAGDTTASPDVAKAFLEAASLSAGKSPDQLASDAAFKEHDRNQRFRDHFEMLAIFALWASAFAICGIGAVWAWHLVAAPRLRWLSTEDISHLQSIVTAGLLVGVIGNHFKKRLG